MREAGTRVALLDRRLVLVSGKGGVGKTTLAATLGRLAAAQGRRTLLCEIEGTGDLAAALGLDALDYRPRLVRTGLFAMSMDLESQLDEYLRAYTRLPFLGRIGPLAKSLSFVATAAPGVQEMLVVGKLADETVRRYDLVVADAPATGHIVSHLTAPQIVGALARVGLIRSQTGRIAAFLSDPERTGLVIVTTPEEMPVGETLELAARVRHETAVDLAGVFVNRVRPVLFNRREEQVARRLARPTLSAVIERHLDGDVNAIFDAGRMASALRHSDAAQIRRLRAGLGAGVPLALLPDVLAAPSTRDPLEVLEDAMRAELGLE